MKGANNSYFGSLAEAIKTSITGFKLTFKHMKEAVSHKRRGVESASDENYFKKQKGIVTLQYPKEKIPVPDNGRYKLHNEIDDCIVCDKCAKVCPVNCIDIEPIKSTEAIGETSDGTVKRLYAAKFDIDMAKCCFCGLCTTVCPTECLTMTKEYDFSVFDINEMNFEFADLTPAEADEKRKAYDEAQKAKQEKILAQKQAEAEKPAGEEKKVSGGKPVFRPKLKPKAASKPSEEKDKKTEDSGEVTKKPAFRPKMKAVVKPKSEEEKKEEPSNEIKGTSDSPKPKFRPKIKAKIKPKEDNPIESPEAKPQEESAEKPKFRPKIRPKIKVKGSGGENPNASEKPKEEVKAEAPEEKKVFRPKIRPKIKPKTEDVADKPIETSETKPQEEKENKPVFKPKMRPVNKKKEDGEE